MEVAFESVSMGVAMTSRLFSRRKLLSYLAAFGAMPNASFADAPVDSASGPTPLTAQDGQLLVTRDALVQMNGRLVGHVRLSETDRPVLGPGADEAVHRLLSQLVATRQAAGNHGDLYENRDRGHSRLSAESHPQMTHVVYDDALRQAQLDYGPAGPVLFDTPLIGNSSTAVRDGPFWRSLPRMMLTSPNGPVLLFQNYLAGHIHVYPEHRDHDPENGDLFPANTPFFLVSQGSSRSDRPHLEALAMILAALRPETKAYLHQSQLLAATVQMIFRRNLTSVRSPEAYRSGLAHGSVIPRNQINPMRMVNLANALTLEAIPPIVRVNVASETQSVDGITHFGVGLNERLFDTPVAVSRIWRSSAYERSMVVSVDTLGGTQSQAPRFLWQVLRGDGARIRIELLDDRGTRARITTTWQERGRVPGRSELSSSRIDIGVFAETGLHDSMPALISILLPHHEARRYETGPDGGMRLVSRDFGNPAGLYSDPALFPRAAWRDTYRYATDGQFLGWEREHAGALQEFDAQGRILTDQGPRSVRYNIEHDEDGVPHIRPSILS